MKRIWSLALLIVLVAGIPLAAGAKAPPAVERIGDGSNQLAVSSGYPAGPAPQALLWDNGPMITHPNGGYNGNPASALQSALLMNTYGFGHQYTYQYRMADDFTVPAGCYWTLDAIQFYAYQTGTYGYPPVSTITGVYYQVWNGAPWAGGQVICGDLATNRMTATAWSGIYRVLDTALTNTQRPIMEDTVSIPPGCETLQAGTYWLEWMTNGSLASGPWANPITILGQTTTGNAYQYTTAWAPALDTGTSTPQGMPFRVFGTEYCQPPCEPPTNLDFSWDPADPEVGEDVTFTGTANGTEPLTYDWDFGDGTGQGNPVTHAYGAAGTYDVTMTVSNACGTASVTKQITISEPPPTCFTHLYRTKINGAAAARPGWIKAVFAGIVHDQNHAVVAGATVYGHWVLPDSSIVNDQFVTTALGQFKLRYKGLWMTPGTYTAYVDNIVYGNCAYDPAANEAPDTRSVTIPQPPY